jgi:TolA-binding protein
VIRRITLLLLLWPASSAPAQDTGSSPGGAAELAQLYSQGMAEFQAGDYAKAATDLESLLAKAEFNPQMEPAFFSLGSAYFNAGDYRKAITAFKNYQTKFPRGPHASDATFGMAQANLMTKNYGEAASLFSALEKDPQYRDRALFFGARASKEAGKTDQAISQLEKLAGGELKGALSVRGAIMLAQLYSQKGMSEKIVPLVRKLHERIALVQNIVELNATMVNLGDKLYAKNFYTDALECYRAAYPREQILRLQNNRLAAMQRAIDENLATARANPSQFAQLAAANSQIKGEMEEARKLLDEFQKLPSITPAIYIRMARCYYEIDRKWEAVVVYKEIIDRFGQVPEREPALFGLIVALADVNQAQKAEERCEQYLREFKNGPNAETVGYMMGVVALQANDPHAAEANFGRILKAQPNSKFRDQMRFLLGNAKFMEGKYDEATADYKEYLRDFPKGQNFEEADYRLALTALFSGKYQDAMNQLQAYLRKYPRGAFVSDAKYRLAVCKYAASLYDEVVADCQAWEREFPRDKQLGEVLALQADAYAATDRTDDAIRLYIESYKKATTDEVVNYSLFAASKLLQKRGEWNKVADLFGDFIEQKPDSPTVVSALYWIGKARAHEGKLDEAKKLGAETIKKYIDDPSREGVELLLTQLAQLCIKKTPASGGPSSATPGSQEHAPPADPGAELDALLGSTENDTTATAKARILFAKAELARLRRQPAEEEKNIARIADEFKPDDLSPLLLGRVGDYLLGKNEPDKAAKFYQKLMDDYPKSENVDFAYNGLGEIAFQKRDYTNALRYFSDGTDRIAATQKLKDLTVGKAKTLLAMDKLDEAKKVFEQVASVREWRGEATAFSVFSLGEIEARKGHWAEANAYFQRVYVAYQKFLPWVAKAYIRSGESFEKLGKTQAAVNTYREMLRNEKLSGFTEAAEARKRLQALGQG